MSVIAGDVHADHDAEMLARPIMNAGGRLHLVRDVPLPGSISPQAQQALTAAYKQPLADYLKKFPSHLEPDKWREVNAASDKAQESIAEYLLKNSNCTMQTVTLGKVTTYRAETDRQHTNNGKVLLVIHGGALVRQGGKMAQAVAAYTAAHVNFPVYAPDYSMPPDHPYPQALDEIVSAYDALLANGKPGNIVFYGISAGGNLATAAVLKIRDKGMPLPAGLILLSPEVDLTESGDSFQTNLGLDPVLRGSLMEANLLYANGNDLKNPYLSPLFADFTQGFPPTYIQSGTRDLLLSNAVRLHRKLNRAHIRTELQIWDGMPHGGFGETPEDLEIYDSVRQFIDAL